jgi:competence protein CoiA
MQIAIDSENNTEITAREALTGKDYYCIDCGAVVRSRKRGPFASFHHFKPHKKNKTALEHTLIQQEIFKRLPKSCIEYPIPHIKRKADVLDLEKKWVYEVQCSPISLKEVLNREKDYAKQGFTIIWILHDARFNKKHVGPAEHHIRSTQGCYFATCGEWGVSFLYHQEDLVIGSKRVKIYGSKPADLTKKPIPQLTKKAKRPPLQMRKWLLEKFDAFLRFLAYKYN